MKTLRWYRFFLMFLFTLVGFSFFTACDSAKDVIDEATGNRAVKQYHRTTKKLDGVDPADTEGTRLAVAPLCVSASLICFTRKNLGIRSWSANQVGTDPRDGQSQEPDNTRSPPPERNP